MAGRPKKPLALVRMEGNRGKRKIPTVSEEIKAPPVAPECPEWLDKVARAEWDRIVPQLVNIGVLGRVDMAEIAVYCQEWSRYAEYQKILSKSTASDRASKKERIAAKDCALVIRSICSDFGMNASSRARMSVPGKNEEDEFDALLKEVK